MSREDQYNVTVAIDGKSWDVFDKLSGGEMDSEETKYKAGGMKPPRSLGGSIMTSNITVSRNYELGRDDVMLSALRARVGKGKAIVSKQSLDVDGNAFGRPLVYTGVLKQVSPPDVGSESDNAAMIELEISTDANTS